MGKQGAWFQEICWLKGGITCRFQEIQLLKETSSSISTDLFVKRDEQWQSLISTDLFVERDEQQQSSISIDSFIEIGDHVQQPSRHSLDEEQRSQGRVSQRQARAQTSERAQKMLKEAAIRQMGVDRLNISRYYQIAIAISWRYCRED